MAAKASNKQASEPVGQPAKAPKRRTAGSESNAALVVKASAAAPAAPSPVAVVRPAVAAVAKRKVLLVDDHPMVRERLAELIEQEPDLMVCGEAEDVVGAMEAVEQFEPDMAV